MFKAQHGRQGCGSQATKGRVGEIISELMGYCKALAFDLNKENKERDFRIKVSRCGLHLKITHQLSVCRND